MPAVVTNLDQLPLTLTLTEIAAVYRVSVSTIRRKLQNGTFRPRPFERYPYRWKRDDVAADLAGAASSWDPVGPQTPARRMSP